MRRIALALFILTAMPAFAVQPDEMLDDPALEARARDISKGLRCLVCRNENIDESHADLARDLRLLVRERLDAGDTDEQVMAYVVDRYGEYVLLRPRASGANLALWLAGPVTLAAGIGGALIYQRRRRLADEGVAADLSDDEARRLREILEEPR